MNDDITRGTHLLLADDRDDGIHNMLLQFDQYAIAQTNRSYCVSRGCNRCRSTTATTARGIVLVVEYSTHAKSSSHSAIDESTGSTTNHRHHDEQSKRGEEDGVPLSFASPYTLLGAPDSKYQQYHCVVDSSQEDRAVEIQLGSMARPHMRGFHLAWMAFFVAFFTWFALTPLLSEIAISLNLTKEQIWTSSIFGVAGSAVTRILIGPVCDKYGARWAMGGTLFLSAIPMALTGLVQTSVGLSILRLFIGLAGSAFVTSQYWTSTMFTPEVAGTANALVAGW